MTMSFNDEIEKMIVEKGITAPRLTPAYIESLIIAEQYIVPGDVPNAPIRLKGGDDKLALPSLKRTTICTLVLKNGYVIVGSSACIHSDAFDVEIGRTIARKDAVAGIWQLEGYNARTVLHANRGPVVAK